MIKATVFDYGNVVSLPNDGSCYVKMQEKTGVPTVVFKTEMEFFRDDFDRGLLSGAQLYSKILKKAGYDELAKNAELCSEIAKYDMDSWCGYNEQVSDWALSLKKNGYKLGVLSNMPFEFLDYYEKDIPVFTNADVAIFSCREKLIKPDPQIYRKLLEKLGVLPEETVFFDDLPKNIDAACALGIRGIVWKNLEQAQADFQKVLRG